MHAKNWIQIGATAAIFALAEAAFAVPLTLTGPVANNSSAHKVRALPASSRLRIVHSRLDSVSITLRHRVLSAPTICTAPRPTATVPTVSKARPYTVSQIEAVVGSVFQIAIDVNTARRGGDSAAFRGNREWRGSLQLRWAYPDR
jgi:hypothetical protein